MVLHDFTKQCLLTSCIRAAQNSYIEEFQYALVGVFGQPGDIRDMPFDNVVNGLKAGLDEFAQAHTQRPRG